MSEWDKTKLARSYNKEEKEYDEAIEKVIEAMIAAKPVGGKSVYLYDGEAYEVGEIPPEQLEKQKKRPYLSEEDKAVADKAAKLIARDYGEALRRLGEE